MEFLEQLKVALLSSPFFIVLLIMVGADMIFGSLRAAKYRKWNSSIGIDGGIRKVAMLFACICLTMIDLILHLNVLSWLPEEAQNAVAMIGFEKMAIAELFTLLFIMYEATSVLKNFALCGLPLPKGLRQKLAKWLDTMTDETNVNVSAELVE